MAETSSEAAPCPGGTLLFSGATDWAMVNRAGGKASKKNPAVCPHNNQSWSPDLWRCKSRLSHDDLAYLRKLWLNCCVSRLSCAQADAARAERYPNLVSPTRLKVLAVRRTVGHTVTQRSEIHTCVVDFRSIRSCRYRGPLLLQAATCALTASPPPTSLCRK